MKNTINKNKKNNKLKKWIELKIEDLIIYLEKMIKEMKNIYDKFYNKNKNLLKKYF